MKAFLIFVTLAALCVLSYETLDFEELGELCAQIPEEVKQQVLECSVSNIDENSQRILQEIEKCSDTTLISLVQSSCTSPVSPDILRFEECEEQFGDLDPIIFNETGAHICLKHKLEGTELFNKYYPNVGTTPEADT